MLDLLFAAVLRFVVELCAAGFLLVAPADLDLDAAVVLDPPLAELLFEATGFLVVDDGAFLVVDEALLATFFDEAADALDFALVAPDLEADDFDDVDFEPADLVDPVFAVDGDLALEDFLVVAMILYSSV